jgi:hypothetical protein
MTQDELAAKYHWRMKYPKTYEMALRNHFLDGELPPEAVAPELEPQPGKSAVDMKAARQKRAIEKLRTGADTLADLSSAELGKRRSRGRNRHTQWTGRPAQPGGLDVGAFLEEILDRLTGMERALDAVAAKLE